MLTGVVREYVDVFRLELLHNILSFPRLKHRNIPLLPYLPYPPPPFPPSSSCQHHTQGTVLIHFIFELVKKVMRHRTIQTKERDEYTKCHAMETCNVDARMSRHNVVWHVMDTTTSRVYAPEPETR